MTSLNLPPRGSARLLLGLAAMALAGLSLAAQGQDRESLLAAAMAHSPTMAGAANDLAAARDKALYSASFWQSSLGVSGQYKDTIGSAASGATAAPAGNAAASTSSTGLGGTATLSLKPFSFLGVDASLDSNLKYSVGLNVKPFADSSQERSAQQALEDQLLKSSDSAASLKASIYKAWASWAKAFRQSELAGFSLQSQERILAERQIRYDAGALSGADLDSVQSDLLAAQKTRNDQAVAELQARLSLLNAAGLDLQQTLQVPPAPDSASLRQRVQAVIDGKKALRSDLSLQLASRGLDRATADSTRAPGLLSGLSASASISGATTSAAPSWQAGLSFSIAASSFTPQESANRQRAISSAQQQLDAASYQTASNQAVAGQRLSGALALAESAELQRAKSQKSFDTEQLRFDAGSSSVQKLADATLSLRRAAASADAAWWDLEIELLSWQE